MENAVKSAEARDLQDGPDGGVGAGDDASGEAGPEVEGTRAELLGEA